MSKSAFNPLTQGIYRGISPLFYTFEATRLNMRPYAFAIRITYAMWQTLKHYLTMPMAQLRKWSGIINYEKMWVPPSDQAHSRWGIDGTAVTIHHIREQENRDRTELRFDLRAGSANCPDLLALYITMDVFFCALQQVVQCDADWGKDHDDYVYPLKKMDTTVDGQPSTQLINVESMDPCGVKVALSPLFINWLSDPTKHQDLDYLFDETEHQMYLVAAYLGPMDGLCHGIDKKLEIGWNLPLDNDRNWWLRFSSDEPRIGLRPRKVNKGKIDTQYGYRLINAGTASVYRGIDEKRMVANLIFLITLAELVHKATMTGAYLHSPGPFKHNTKS